MAAIVIIGILLFGNALLAIQWARCDQDKNDLLKAFVTLAAWQRLRLERDLVCQVRPGFGTVRNRNTVVVKAFQTAVRIAKKSNPKLAKEMKKAT